MADVQPLRLGNRIILTIGRAAERYRHLGIRDRKQMQTTISRLGVPELLVLDESGDLVPVIDARTPVYYQADLDRAMEGRPGRGANLRGAAAVSAGIAPPAARSRPQRTRGVSGRTG